MSYKFVVLSSYFCGTMDSSWVLLQEGELSDISYRKAKLMYSGR